MNASIYNQLMSHDVIVEKIDIDGYGQRQVVATYNEKGFVQYDRHRVVSNKNEEITCDAIAFLKNDSGFDPKHDLWDITDVKHNNKMQMKGFQVIDDPREGKTHHYEISIL